MTKTLKYSAVAVLLILLGGCLTTQRPVPTERPSSAPIPTPPDAPAEPTFKPDVLPPH
jgi:hypothetical protein